MIKHNCIVIITIDRCLHIDLLLQFCNDEFNEYHLWKLDKMTFLPIFYIDFRGQPFLRNLELKSDILTLKR